MDSKSNVNWALLMKKALKKTKKHSWTIEKKMARTREHSQTQGVASCNWRRRRRNEREQVNCCRLAGRRGKLGRGWRGEAGTVLHGKAMGRRDMDHSMKEEKLTRERGMTWKPPKIFLKWVTSWVHDTSATVADFGRNSRSVKNPQSKIFLKWLLVSNAL